MVKHIELNFTQVIALAAGIVLVNVLLFIMLFQSFNNTAETPTISPTAVMATATIDGIPTMSSPPTLENTPEATGTPSPAADGATSTPTLTVSLTVSPPVTTPTAGGGTPICSAPPSGWVQYTVQRHDTLYSLAVRTHSTVAALIQANCLPNNDIYVGQLLWLPVYPVIIPTLTPTPTVLPTTTPTPTLTASPTPSPTAILPTPTATATPSPTLTLPPPTPTFTVTLPTSTAP